MAHLYLAAFIVEDEPKLAAICSTITPRASKKNARSEVAAFSVAWTCATTGRLLPAGYGERVRGLPFGDAPAVHFVTTEEAEVLAGTIAANGPCRAGQRDAVALLAWWAAMGLPPSQTAAIALGIAFGLIDHATGAPTMSALGIALGTRLPEMVRDAAVRDGESLAHRGRRASIGEHGRALGRAGDLRALRAARSTPGYDALMHAVARSLTPRPLTDSEPAPEPPMPRAAPLPEPIAETPVPSEGIRLQQAQSAAGLRSIAVRPAGEVRGTFPARWIPPPDHQIFDQQHRNATRSIEWES